MEEVESIQNQTSTVHPYICIYIRVYLCPDAISLLQTLGPNMAWHANK